MLLVSNRYGMLFYTKKLSPSEEPGIYLREIVSVPSMSITKPTGWDCN